MQVSSSVWLADSGWQKTGIDDVKDAQLVLYFASPSAIKDKAALAELKAAYPNAHLLGCSTGGEIAGPSVLDNTIVASAVRFDHTTLKAVQLPLNDSQETGRRLGEMLTGPDLVNVFILSDGIHANGSALVKGLYEVLPESVIVTGGLAGDGADFKQTFVGLDGELSENIVAAIGFYGKRLKIGCGSMGGWDMFGPQRIITKSDGRVLYELDGQPALELYRRYLGEHAAGLPGSGLLFPLSIQPTQDSNDSLVRTIVGMDEASQSLIFAGDIPQGWVARLMRGNYDRLVDGAAQAAEMAVKSTPGSSLSILVSCIGRKLLMGQRIADESEAAAEILGEKNAIIGFYSYGEICMHAFTNQCRLHNQTMTITTMAEL